MLFAHFVCALSVERNLQQDNIAKPIACHKLIPLHCPRLAKRIRRNKSRKT